MRFGWAATALIYHERPRISTNDLSHGALSPCAIVRRALHLPPLVAGLLLVNQMNRVILDLAAALRERLAIISDESSRRDPEAHTARLQAISEKIEKLAAAMPKPIDPQLAHFLRRKSYDKALEFLENNRV